MLRHLGPAVLCLLLVGGMVVPGVAVAETPTRVTVLVDRTPEEVGSIDVTVRYTDPPRESVRVPWLLGDDGTLLSAEGFERVNATTFKWDERTASPEIRTRLEVSTSTWRGSDPLVERESWAFVDASVFGGGSPEWFGVGRSEFKLDTVGPGHRHGRWLYLGETSSTSTMVSGRQVQLVVPDAAVQLKHEQSMSAAVAAGDRHLPLGDIERVSILLLPGDVRTAELGMADGRNHVWIRDDAAVTAPQSTLLHEYAHLRDRSRKSARMAWFTEASASYYEELLGLNLGEESYSLFLRSMRTQAFSGATLADEETWGTAGYAPYAKGKRVLAALDAGIRRDTNGTRSLLDVHRRLNGDVITYEKFVSTVVEVSGDDRWESWLDRYVLTDAVPPVPDAPHRYTLDTAPDPDGDGLSNRREATLDSHPFLDDTDRDGLADAAELEAGTDLDAVDTDGDRLGDAAELNHGTDPLVADTDGDGLRDGFELALATDPLVPDTDGDGLSDGQERDIGSDPLRPDTDGDGLPDPEEQRRGSDPTAVDGDGDGLSDPVEFDLGTDPLVADTDGDTHTDGVEQLQGTDPLVADTDGDGLPDERERELGTNRTAADTDGDGLVDPRELELGTDPTAADSDGDGYRDGLEVRTGTDPQTRTGFLDRVEARLISLISP